MESAKAGLERIKNAVSNLNDIAGRASGSGMSEEERAALEKAGEFKARFNEVMDNDLNTADGISVIFDLVKYANTTTADTASGEYAAALKEMIKELGDVMGLIFETKEEDLDSEIEKLIEERQQARKEKNFARADEIRDELLAKGIQLKDTREGVKWSRI